MSLTHFLNYSTEQFMYLHNNVYVKASAPTKSTFRTGLQRIEKLYLNELQNLHLKFLENPEGLWLLLKNSKYSKSTQVGTLTQILKLLKLMDAPLLMYNKFQTIKNREINALNKTRLDDLESIGNDIPKYNELRDISRSVSNKFFEDDITYNEFRNYLIMNLFLLQIPTRSTAYVSCEIVGSAPEEEKHNYLIKGTTGYRFIFTKYKTFNTIKRKILFVTDELLIKLLDRYFEKYYVKEHGGDWFLKNMNGNEMRNKDIISAVNMVSEIIYDIPISIENIRHAYIKHQILTDPDLVDKMEIAQIMGYKNIPN